MSEPDDKFIEKLREDQEYNLRKLREIEDARDNFLGEKAREANAEAAKRFGPEIERRQSILNESATALREAEDRQRFEETKAKLPFPEGTKMRRREPKSALVRHYGLKHPFAKGVLEIYCVGDPCPANWRWWNKPKPGELIVRAIKKDGSKGTLLEE